MHSFRIKIIVFRTLLCVHIEIHGVIQSFTLHIDCTRCIFEPILCEEEEWKLVCGKNSSLDAILEHGSAENGECYFCDVSVC